MGRKIKNTRRRGDTLQAYVNVMIDGQARQITTTFPRDTPAAEIALWVAATKQRYRLADPDTPGSMAALCTAYLETVRSMPTFLQRAAHLQLWVQALGPQRPATSITALELNRVMDGWARTPTNQPDPDQPGRRGRPSAPAGLNNATIKKRRASLRAMFNAVNGKSGWNPVRDSKCPTVPARADARGIPLEDAQRILDAMPDQVWIGPGISRPALNKIRATIMLWTGFPPKVIGSICRQDLALDAVVPTVRVERKKGEGIEERVVPLTPQAVAAFRALLMAEGLGPFWAGPLNVSVKRAAHQAGIDVPGTFRAYDLRHSFGSALYADTKDTAVVGRALLHAENSTMARRYTQAAHAEVDAAAIAALGARHATPAPEPDRYKILSPNPVRAPKLVKKRKLA